MRLVRVATADGSRYAAIIEGLAVEARIEPRGVVLGDVLGPSGSLSRRPVVSPTKIVGVGLNYSTHANEAGADVPSSPLTFAKYPSSVVDDGEPIRVPSEVNQLDYEAELGVVIGWSARDVSVSSALDFVLGYTCVNDVSARDIHLPEGQWTRGKSFDTFCPVGPHIVTADEIPDPQNLRISSRVDGVIRQNDTTANMVFAVDELVAFISRDTTLNPGDLICTGTPAGVAFGENPPRWLQPGSLVTIDIESIGTLENPVLVRETND